jgi:two-component system response regulator YesN
MLPDYPPEGGTPTVLITPLHIHHRRQDFLDSLHELFQRELGCSIGKVLTRSRIEHISRLLMDTELQIQEVAEAVGYDDVRHFARYFKHSTGLTPQAYRRKVLAP